MNQEGKEEDKKTKGFFFELGKSLGACWTMEGEEVEDEGNLLDGYGLEVFLRDWKRSIIEKGDSFQGVFLS